MICNFITLTVQKDGKAEQHLRLNCSRQSSCAWVSSGERGASAYSPAEFLKAVL